LVIGLQIHGYLFSRRMAQFGSLDSRAERFFFQRVLAALLAMRLRAEAVSFLARAFPPRLENSAWFIELISSSSFQNRRSTQCAIRLWCDEFYPKRPKRHRTF
jgi:hypothetical protein